MKSETRPDTGTDPAETSSSDGGAEKPKAMKRGRRELPTLAGDAAELALMIGVSERSIQTYDAAGLIPRPIRLAGRTLWNVDEVRRWLDAGGPSRDEWELMKKAGRV